MLSVLEQVKTPSVALPTPRPIRSEAEYQTALKILDSLWGSEPNTPEHDALGVWILLVSDYERRAGLEIALPPLAYAITEALEEKGLKQADLIDKVGNKTTISRLVRGKRRPTLKQARALYQTLNISPDIILAELRAFIVSDNDPATV